MAMDSHAHYNSLLVPNLEERISEIEASNSIEAVINIATDIKSSIEISALSHQYKKFYNTIGIHPLNDGDVSVLLSLYKNVDNSRIVGIGEAGMDSNNIDIERQKKSLIMQIELANHLKLPIVIHSLNYNEVIFKILKQNTPLYGYVFHCFQPDVEMSKMIVMAGGFISIGGPVTYKTACKSIEVVKCLPLESLLVETDSPYMTPEPLRGSVNTSFNLRYIIDKIAFIKGLDYAEIESVTTGNVKRLFPKIK